MSPHPVDLPHPSPKNISEARRELQTKCFHDADPGRDGKFTPREFIYWYSIGRHLDGGRQGDGARRCPRDGDAPKPGPRDGEGVKTGPRDGERR